MSPIILGLGSLFVFLAVIVRGYAGFGFSLLAITALSLITPPATRLLAGLERRRRDFSVQSAKAPASERPMSAEIEIRRYSGGDRHFHDYCQVLFPLRGSMRIAIEGRCDIVSSNAIAVIPERSTHDF